MRGAAAVDVSIVKPDGGDAIALGPIRMRILEDGGTTGHRLGIGEITLPPRTDGPPQHRHARHDEGFYVVSGSATFTVGETTYDAPAGTLVMVPPGAPHTFANLGDEPAVLLNTFTPDLYVQSQRHRQRRGGARRRMGELRFCSAAPEVGAEWTDDGARREQRRLKARAEGEWRRDPVPAGDTRRT